MESMPSSIDFPNPIFDLHEWWICARSEEKQVLFDPFENSPRNFPRAMRISM